MRIFRTLIKIVSPQTWRRVLHAFVLYIIPVFLFVQLADEVLEQDTLPYDEVVLHAVNSLSSPFLDAVNVALTQLGGVIGVLAITAGFVPLLWGRKMRKMALLLAIGVGGAAVLNVLLKTVFQRDRPQLWERLVTENSHSFPSGHAMASSALAISLMVVFWPTRWRWWAVGVGILYMAVIAFTRLYLGVHYPTDIIAGWIVSGLWVALVTTVLLYRNQISTLFSRTKL